MQCIDQTAYIDSEKPHVKLEAGLAILLARDTENGVPFQCKLLKDPSYFFTGIIFIEKFSSYYSFTALLIFTFLLFSSVKNYQ